MVDQLPPLPMVRRRMVLSLGYWLGAHSLGFLTHPYQSVFRIVRAQFYEALVLMPMVLLIWWWVLGVVLAHANVLLSLGLPQVAGAIALVPYKQQVLSFVFVYGVCFLLLWQLVLLLWYQVIRSALRS